MDGEPVNGSNGASQPGDTPPTPLEPISPTGMTRGARLPRSGSRSMGGKRYPLESQEVESMACLNLARKAKPHSEQCTVLMRCAAGHCAEIGRVCPSRAGE